MREDISAQDLGQEAISPELADHLISTPARDWAFWRCICVRSAGFPAKDILKLAAPAELGAAADHVETALHAKEVSIEKALKEINARLDALKESGQWGNEERRSPLLKARRKLDMKQIPSGSSEIDGLNSLKELRASIAQLDDRRESFRRTFAEMSAQMSQAILGVAGCSRFREAVTWQNRRLAQRVFDSVLRGTSRGGARTSRLRQNEELIATYLQRYCVKNDTIGFFGPVGWGNFVSEGERLKVVPGRGLITARKIYWEVWPLEKVASIMMKNPAVLPWVPPILMPFVRVKGSILQHPVFGALRLPPKQIEIIKSCDGQHSAKEIADEMLRSPKRIFNREEEVYACLRDLVKRRIIFWEINIPPGPYPEQDLRKALEAIGDANVRLSACSVLDQLDAAKQKLAAAAGDVHKLGAAFDELENLFAGFTATKATRHPGKSYAGRTLVYEDCRRDLELSLGPVLLEELTKPLSLLLASARWITAQVRKLYTEKFKEIFNELAGPADNSIVDATLGWLRILPLLSDGAPAFTRPIQQEFQEKWQRVLRLHGESERVNYSSDQLRERVESEFPSVQAGWADARYHSPDVMIAATSQEAVRRGEYFFVLGELHVSANTLSPSLFVNQHPNPEKLLTAVERDLGSSVPIPVNTRRTELGGRTTNCLVPASRLRLEYLHNSFIANRSQALPVSSLLIHSERGQFLAKTCDGRLQFDAIDLVGGLLGAQVLNSFKMMASQPHTPRISIDRLVIKRESWQCSASELAFAREVDAADRYAKVRKWRHALGMPRFVFFKVPVESKPCYLDFESPILVDIFCKMVRRTQEAESEDGLIEVSEMLPGPDQIWLTDAENNHYSSEFRLVVLDLKHNNQ